MKQINSNPHIIAREKLKLVTQIIAYINLRVYVDSEETKIYHGLNKDLATLLPLERILSLTCEITGLSEEEIRKNRTARRAGNLINGRKYFMIAAAIYGDPDMKKPKIRKFKNAFCSTVYQLINRYEDYYQEHELLTEILYRCEKESGGRINNHIPAHYYINNIKDCSTCVYRIDCPEACQSSNFCPMLSPKPNHPTDEFLKHQPAYHLYFN